jgi:hypothetical protein
MSRTRLITLVVLIALIGWFAWGLYATARQARFNNQLASAVENFDVSAVKRLLGEGADPNTREGGARPLWKERFEIILGRRPKPDPGIPLILDAVSWSEDCPPSCDRQFDIAKMLIAHGADINAKEGSNGETALDMAVGLEHQKCVQLLIDNGADVNTRDAYAETPLMTAARTSSESVHLLIAHGAHINAQADDGSTALMQTATWGVPEITPILIGYGADINARDKEGHTALWHARHPSNYNPKVQQQIAILLRQHVAQE